MYASDVCAVGKSIVEVSRKHGGQPLGSFLVRDSDSAAVDTMGTTTFDDCISIGTLNANGMVDVEFPLRELARSGSYGMSVAVCRVSRRDCADNFVFD